MNVIRTFTVAGVGSGYEQRLAGQFLDALFEEAEVRLAKLLDEEAPDFCGTLINGTAPRDIIEAAEKLASNGRRTS